MRVILMHMFAYYYSNQSYYLDCSYNVMSNCWREQPEKQPSFTELVQTLSALLVDTAVDTKGFSEYIV